MRAFSQALEDIPMALAENSGLSPIACVSSVKAAQVETNNPYLGVDCMCSGEISASVRASSIEGGCAHWKKLL